MITEARETIYGLCRGVLPAFYYLEARQEQPYPYGVFFPVSQPVNHDTTPRIYQEIYFQTSIFGETLQDLETTEKSLQEKLENKENYNVSGYIVIGVFRQQSNDFYVDEIWQLNSQYKLEIVKE